MVINTGMMPPAVGLVALLLGSLTGSPAGQMPLALATPASPAVAQAMSNEERAIAFVDLVFAEDYDAALAYLHPLLRSGGEAGLAERTADLENQIGEFQAQQGTETIENVVLVNARFANALNTSIVIIFDEQGLITGIDFPLEPQVL